MRRRHSHERTTQALRGQAGDATQGSPVIGQPVERRQRPNPPLGPIDQPAIGEDAGMQIVAIDELAARNISGFGSRGFEVVPLAADAHVVLARLAPEGVIARHPAVVDQP
jgi:hypothetical protein